MATSKAPFKRIIACCDGTWMNALGHDGDQPQTNVTRISRCIKNTAKDGTNQIVYYHPGVGSTGSAIDSITGGDFGVGLDADIREIYNFIASNYVDGDDIILVGFSRGAFTARSVGDMIASIGLLNIYGFDRFYAIFEDYEFIGDKNRALNKFLCPELPAYQGEKGKALILWEDERKRVYREFLRDAGYTRFVTEDGSREITIKAIGVWDTVGDLGIPPAPVLGIVGSAKEWAFTNVHVSRRILNAFQALALDEPRASFKPALWERVHGNETNLKQVWFPGSHSDVGGGWYDQQIANISLAWMCDQLSTVGVEFNVDNLTKVFVEGLQYSAAHPFPYVTISEAEKLLHPHSKPVPWANADIFPPTEDLKRDTKDAGIQHFSRTADLQKLWETARPWALGQTRYPTSWIQRAVGTIVRHPGLFTRVDEDTNEDTGEPLLSTNERIHSSVRVRLACCGLAMDDKAIWDCKSLTQSTKAGSQPLWTLQRGTGLDPADTAAVEFEVKLGDYSDLKLYPIQPKDNQWYWLYSGTVTTSKDGQQIPLTTVLPEEPLVGYWERYLLALAAGKQDVWKYAEAHPPSTA